MRAMLDRYPSAFFYGLFALASFGFGMITSILYIPFQETVLLALGLIMCFLGLLLFGVAFVEYKQERRSAINEP